MITPNSTSKGYTDNDGYFVTEYDKNWKVTSIKADTDNTDGKKPQKTGNTYTYTDTGADYTYNTNSAGVVLNYSIKYNEPLTGNTITFRYNDKGILQNSVYKDGVKTTTTTYDSNSEVTDTITKFDFNVPGVTKLGNIYTVGNLTSGLEKYTVNTVDGIDEVLTYSITYSDTNTAADGIKNDFTSSTTYDAQGKVISRQDTNVSTDTNPLSSQTDVDVTTLGIQIESSINTKVTNSNGSHAETSRIINQFGTQDSKYFYDANWNLTEVISSGQSDFTDTANSNRVITNIFENTIKYNAGDIVSNINESTSTVGSTIIYKFSSKTADNVNVSGSVIPHLQSSSWEDESGMSGSSESQFDAKWQLLSESGKNTYIETWNNNTKVTSQFTNKPIWNTAKTTIIGNEGTNKTYIFGETDPTKPRDSVKYSSVDKFNAKGLLTGHTTTSEDLVTGDKSTTVYDANWKTISSNSSSSSSFSDATGLHTTTSSYEKVSNFDTAGVLTGYTTTSAWDNFDGVLSPSTIHNKGSSVTESNALDVVKTVTVTENGKITVYNDSGAIISTKIDLSGLGNGTKDSNGFMVYSVTDVNENVTKYYLKGDKLDRFSTTTSETSTDASGIIHDFSNTTNYDSNGRIVGNILTNEYSYMVGTVKTLRDSSIIKSVDNFDKTGNVIGHKVNSSSKNILEHSESTSVTEYNADWTKVISNTDTSISSYTENGVTHTSKTINSTVTNPDGTVTTKSSWEDNDGNKNQSESKYDASGNLLTNTVINGIKSTVYAPDGKIISSSIDVTGLKGIADGVSGLTIYSVIDGNSTTKYYLNAAKNNDLVKYTVSSIDTKVDSGITSRSTNMTTYDDMGNVIAEEGSNSSTYANGVIRESLSYKNINNYNKNGQLLGHTQTSTWSNENGDGNTTKAEFDADWTLLTNTVTDKQGTTVYGATGTVLSSTSDVASLGTILGEDSSNLEFDIYTDVNTGFVTKTYLIKDTKTLVKSSTTQSGTDDAGGLWSNTTTVDATGKVIESSDSYTSNGVIWTNTSTTVDNLDGTHTVINISKKGENTVANSRIEYSADWEIISNSITANGRTTVYDKDGVITETTIDIVSLGVGVEDGSNTVYTLPGTDGGLTTKYYFTTASLTTVPLLVKYSTSFSGSNVWNDGDTDITTTFSVTTTFDKDGNIISSTSENRNYVGTDTTIPHRDISSTTTTKLADGKVKNEYTWEDNHDNSETSFNTSDATGRSLESESYKVNTHSYTTASGVSHTDVSTSKSVSHYDSLGVLSGYTNTNSSTQDDVVKQSSISEYNARGRLISEVVTQNGKTTTTNYDADGNVTNTVTVINVAGFPPNLINGDGLESAFKIHTVTDDSSGEVTKYYLSGTTLHHYTTTTTNIDTWTDENDHEITATYTNTTTFDSTGKSIGNSGKSKSTYVINEETKVIESSTYNNVENADGTHTNTNEWSGEFGSGNSETIFDVNWKKTSERITQNGKITTTTYKSNGDVDTSTTIIDTTNLTSLPSQTINTVTYSVYSLTDSKNGNVTKYYMSGSSLHHYSITNDGESSYTYQDEESGEDVTVTNKYSNTTSFDANDKVIDTISINDSSDSKGVTHHSSIKSTRVEHFSGITLTGYTVTNIIDNDGFTSQSIIAYNALDEIRSTTITENGKTTQYDANWQVMGTPTFDVTGLIETTSSDGLIVYVSDSNPNGSITKYYYNNNSASKVLQYYTETNTRSTTWNDGENEITSTQNDTTKFSATGIVIGRSGDNKSTYYVDGDLKERDYYEYTMVDSGVDDALTHTQTFTSRDESGSEFSSTNISNAQGQNISSDSSTSYSYVDSNGITQKQIWSTHSDTAYSDSGRTVTKTEKYNDVTTSISKEYYGTEGNLISRTVTEGIKLTAYNGNGEVTSESYSFGTNQGNYDAVTHLTSYEMPEDANGNVITYYFDKSIPASSILKQSTVSNSSENYYIDDLSQREITEHITNTTTFDASGKMLSTISENRSTYDDILDPTANEKSYSKYTVEDGKDALNNVIHIQTSIFRDEFGNNVSTSVSNADGKVISSGNVYTDTTTTPSHIYESLSTTVYRDDGSYTVTTVQKIDNVALTSSIDVYDVNGELIEPVDPNNTDHVAPTLSIFSPSDNATGVAIDASITLTFNEPIKAGKGNIVISNDIGTDLRYISVGDLSQVTLSEDKKTLSINLTESLFAGSNYNVTIDTGAIKDLVGNKFAGISDSTAFNFTTLVGGSYLISGEGSSATLSGIDTFNISSGHYTHTIDGGFTTGDKLNFFPGAILNVVPDDDDADNSQSITATDPAMGSVATITFTNLIVDQDEGIYNLQSLKNFVSVGTFSGTISGTTGQDTFTIAVGQNVSINNFSSGDTLKLFPNAILNIVPDANLTDGIKLANVSDPLTGATSVITLTGLTDAQDAGVFNMPSFETQFGATSLVYV